MPRQRLKGNFKKSILLNERSRLTKKLVLAIQGLRNSYPDYKNPGPLFWKAQEQVRQTRGAVSVAGREEVYNEKEKGCFMLG